MTVVNVGSEFGPLEEVIIGIPLGACGSDLRVDAGNG